VKTRFFLGLKVVVIFIGSWLDFRPRFVYENGVRLEFRDCGGSEKERIY
jgi:hypothetical protein